MKNRIIGIMAITLILATAFFAYKSGYICGKSISDENWLLRTSEIENELGDCQWVVVCQRINKWTDYPNGIVLEKRFRDCEPISVDTEVSFETILVWLKCRRCSNDE